MANKKMILDLDTGVDDALAIAYATAAPDVDLIGIVASYGNNYRDICAKNSLKLLELLGQTNVPVYLGLSHSSTSDHFDAMQVSLDIHGQNGIGNVQLPDPKRQPETESGVDFYIDAAHKFGKDLIIVPTGPMTNLAAALEKEPWIAKLIGNVTFMGGALTVEGNVSEAAEANINQDAEAANIVLSNPDLNLTMVGLDVTLRTLLTKKETQQWRDLDTAAGKAYADITDYYIDAYDRLGIDKNGCALHDPLAVGVSLDPSFVQTISLFMKVIHDGADYGRTVANNAKLNLPNPNVKVAVNVDRERYLQTFMDYLTKLFQEH